MCVLSEEENKLYTDPQVVGQLTDKGSKQTTSSQSIFKTRPALEENKKILDILDISTSKIYEDTNNSFVSSSLPPGCKSNLKCSKASEKGKEHRYSTKQRVNDNSTDTGVIPSGFSKTTDIEQGGEKSELMPKGFKIPQFNKFSSKNRNKTGKMETDIDVGRSEALVESSSIKRSKVYEKLLAKQLKHKKNSGDNLQDDFSFKERESYDSKNSHSHERDEATRKDVYERGENRDSGRYYGQSRRSDGYRDDQRHIAQKTSYNQETHKRGEWISRNGTEAASSKLVRSGGGSGTFHSEKELSGYSDHDRSYSESRHNTTRKSNEWLDSGVVGSYLDKDISSRERYRSMDSGVVGPNLDNDRSSRERYRSLEHLSSNDHNRQKESSTLSRGHSGGSLDRSYTSSSRDRHDLNRRSNEHRYTSDTDYSSRGSYQHRPAVSENSHERESGYYSDTGRERRNDGHLDRYYSETDIRSESREQRPDYSGREVRNSRVSFEKDYDRQQQPQIRTPLVTSRTSQLANKTGTGRGTFNERAVDDRTKEVSVCKSKSYSKNVQV